MSLSLPFANSKTKKMTLSEQVFGCGYNEALIHQVVTSYLSNARSHTKAQKTRSEVRGGGAKPWRQKGSGRARAGSIRSPIWRGGGVTFAAKPRAIQNKVNREMYRGAMRSIFSTLLSQERIFLFEEPKFDAPKTKLMLDFLEKKLALPKDKCITLVVTEFNENLFLASRNLLRLCVVEARELDPYLLVRSDLVLATESAVKEIEECFS